MKKIRVGVVGGAGYTGGELLRLLINHPQVEIAFVHSKSSAGHYLYEVHGDLLGETDLKFTDTLLQDMDVVFLCLGHGESKRFLKENPLNKDIRIIDLSQDFRLYEEGNTFTYGLSEWNREKIRSAKAIANPGCFATCIQLALLPLAANKVLDKDLHISATTGSTGAGQSLSETSHFSWRNNNLSVYKAFTHQHLAEIKQSIREQDSSFNTDLNFIPYRGNFSRGIFASLYTTSSLSLEEAYTLFEKAYCNTPFVKVSRQPIDLKQVVNTNKCLLYLEKQDDKLLITSAIDNLLKGASGQALQNMNLIFGLEETAGLKLKASAF